jgi:hypothetical protein
MPIFLSELNRSAIANRFQVELSTLQHARNVGAVLQRQERDVVCWIAPKRMAVRCRPVDQETGQSHSSITRHNLTSARSRRPTTPMAPFDCSHENKAVLNTFKMHQRRYNFQALARRR